MTLSIIIAERLTRKKVIIPVLLQTIPKLIELKPDFAVACSNRGRAYHAKGDYSRATADYDKAIELNPSIELPPNAAVAIILIAEWLIAKRAKILLPSKPMTNR